MVTKIDVSIFLRCFFVYTYNCQLDILFSSYNLFFVVFNWYGEDYCVRAWPCISRFSVDTIISVTLSL